MRIILTRHGRTEENDAGILQGHLPGTLSEKGRLQARRISERLAFERIDHAYSSDLARSANTAREIMKRHPGVPLEFTKDLREAFLGDWQGKTKAELGLLNRSEAPNSTPGACETPEEMKERARVFLESVKSRHPRETVLLLGHDGINRKVVEVLTDAQNTEGMKNASVSVFEVGDGEVVTTLFNDTRHLD